MLTYGVIGGFGLGLIYLPAVVAVGYYFEKRRALATGISVCGSGVGTFLFAPLSTALLNAVDWKAANLVFAGTLGYAKNLVELRGCLQLYTLYVLDNGGILDSSLLFYKVQ